MTHTVISCDYNGLKYAIARSDGAIVCHARFIEHAYAAAEIFNGQPPSLDLSTLPIRSLSPQLTDDPQPLFCVGRTPLVPLFACYRYSDAQRIVRATCSHPHTQDTP